ncbi:unnamed protein product [Clonostachys rhizophaga]|uniref:Uncharacterized protein n=1 Tax=Clonostachys rhizophaga TaxID=160324 RepID=A0A9N9VPE6_9HYPO|nr:unnamed protein product [Clonostachys rhizophaga]
MQYGSFQSAYDQIKSSAKSFADNVPLILPGDFDLNRQDSMLTVCPLNNFNAYLKNLEPTNLTDFNSLREFKVPDANKVDWPKSEQAASHILVRINFAADLALSPDEYIAHLRYFLDLGRTRAIYKLLNEHNIDVIIGPADSQFINIAAAAGYPVASLPPGCLDDKVLAIAGANHEVKLFETMDNWYATCGPMEPLPLVAEGLEAEVSS